MGIADTDETGARRYADCMAEAARNPDGAFDQAQSWSYEGGGFPARHCAATALMSLNHYAEAATRLEHLAEDMGAGYAHLRPQVLGQAARGWMLAGNLDRALSVYNAALKLSPGDPDLLVDRSTIWALAGEYWNAVDDLNAALDARPDDTSALVMRAGAYRLLESGEMAMADIERALELSPNNVDALLERGNLKRLFGDDDAARADWIMVIQLAPESIAADDARINIEKMDVRVDG